MLPSLNSWIICFVFIFIPVIGFSGDKPRELQNFFDQGTPVHFEVLSEKQCKTNSEGMLTGCQFQEMTFGEERKDLPNLPYRTVIIVDRSLECSRTSRGENLKVEVFSTDGTFLASKTLDIFRKVHTQIILPSYQQAGSIHFQTESSLLYESALYPPKCEIHLAVTMNLPAARFREESVAILNKLKNKLEREQERFDILSLLGQSGAVQNSLATAFQSWLSRFTGTSPQTSLLLNLDLTKVKRILTKQLLNSDHESKKVLEGLSEILDSLKTQSKLQPGKNLVDLLSTKELKHYEANMEQIFNYVTPEKLEAIKTSLDRKQLNYALSEKTLLEFFEGETERKSIEDEFQNILNEEINGRTGLIERIQSKLSQHKIEK